jgi:hypothetical protein
MIKFREFMEMAGTFGIVSCKDKKNPDFQVWGAMSDCGCSDESSKIPKMKFNDWSRSRKRKK